MFLFIFERERQTEHEQGETERERETQNLKQAPGFNFQHRAQRGARTHEPQDHDLSRDQESGA